MRDGNRSAVMPILQCLGKTVVVVGGQVAVPVAAFQRLAQQVGGGSIGDALFDRCRGGDSGDLLPPADLRRSEVFMVNDVTVRVGAAQTTALGERDMDHVGVNVTDLIGSQSCLVTQARLLSARPQHRHHERVILADRVLREAVYPESSPLQRSPAKHHLQGVFADAQVGSLTCSDEPVLRLRDVPQHIACQPILDHANSIMEPLHYWRRVGDHYGRGVLAAVHSRSAASSLIWLDPVAWLDTEVRKISQAWIVEGADNKPPIEEAVELLTSCLR